jgi:glucose-1-phosphate thymidylyltransferase
MIAIILAAGYSTRLFPLTKNTPKALLRIGKVAIVERVLAKIITVPAIDRIYIVSNSKFYPQFSEWLHGYERRKAADTGIMLVDDGTWTNETRLGAIGDLVFVIDKHKIDDSVLLLACDNLFEIDLGELCNFSAEKQASVVAAYEYPTLDEVRNRFGVLVTDDTGRVIEFQEKPAAPKSALAAAALYVVKREHLTHIVELHRTLQGREINLGELISALLKAGAPLYCRRLPFWIDIGTLKDLQGAEKYYAERE